MPLWGNTDASGKASVPKFVMERTVEEFAQLTTTANTLTGGAVLFFGTANNVANAGIANGMCVIGTGLGGNGVGGFFSSNNTVINVSGNTVTLNVAATANVAIGASIEFDVSIKYKGNTQANTYFSDTILVTPSRLANAKVAVDHTHAGWNHVQRKLNGDGTLRYINECLVAMSNVTAQFTASGNTSANQIYSGV